MNKYNRSTRTIARYILGIKRSKKYMNNLEKIISITENPILKEYYINKLDDEKIYINKYIKEINEFILIYNIKKYI